MRDSVLRVKRSKTLSELMIAEVKRGNHLANGCNGTLIDQRNVNDTEEKIKWKMDHVGTSTRWILKIRPLYYTILLKLKFIFNFVQKDWFSWSYIEEKKKSLRNQNPVNISHLPSVAKASGLWAINVEVKRDIYCLMELKEWRETKRNQKYNKYRIKNNNWKKINDCIRRKHKEKIIVLKEP